MAQPFDVQNPFWVTPQYAAEKIQSPWIGQCLSDSWVSRAIRYGTQGAHSHSMLFLRNMWDDLDVLEVREFKGGRRKTFNYHVNQTGRIDVFSPDVTRWPNFNPLQAGYAMREMVDHNYGWWGVFHMFLRRTPGIWRLYSQTTVDQLPTETSPVRQPFCSHAVSLSTHRGGVDPVPRCPHWLVSPSMLTQSLFYRYEFTIASPYCAKSYDGDLLSLALKNEELLSQ